MRRVNEVCMCVCVCVCEEISPSPVDNPSGCLQIDELGSWEAKKKKMLRTDTLAPWRRRGGRSRGWEAGFMNLLGGIFLPGPDMCLWTCWRQKAEWSHCLACLRERGTSLGTGGTQAYFVVFFRREDRAGKPLCERKTRLSGKLKRTEVGV